MECDLNSMHFTYKIQHVQNTQYCKSHINCVRLISRYSQDDKFAIIKKKRHERANFMHSTHKVVKKLVYCEGKKLLNSIISNIGENYNAAN